MVCCLPTCAQGSSVAVTEVVWNGVFWAFLVLLGALCVLEVLALLVYSLLRTGLGYAGVPIAGHALWAEVGGGIIFVAFGQFSSLHKTSPIFILGMEVIPGVKCRRC